MVQEALRLNIAVGWSDGKSRRAVKGDVMKRTVSSNTGWLVSLELFEFWALVFPCVLDIEDFPRNRRMEKGGPKKTFKFSIVGPFLMKHAPA